MEKKLRILNSFLVIAVFSLFISGCSDDHDTSITAKGKVIQSPVSGATVFFDMNGNRAWDDNEPKAKSQTDAQGNYEINIKDGLAGVLCSIGGTYTGASGEIIPALPMIAPKGKTQNITVLTTLVAINPGLKSVIGDTWNSDPYNDYMPPKVIRLKVVLEKYLMSLRNLGKDNKQLLDSMILLSGELSNCNLRDSEEIETAIKKSLTTAVCAGAGVKSPADLSVAEKSTLDFLQGSILKTFRAVDLKNIPENIADLEKLSNGSNLVFDLVNSVIPLPNDLAWSAPDEDDGLKVDLKPEEIDVSTPEGVKKKFLYTALNALDINGLSPNTPISIPLSKSYQIDENSFSQNIRLIKSGALPAPVTDIKIIQDENFIKVFPAKPLDPDSKYLLLVLSGLKIKGTKDTVGKNYIFELLKQSQPLCALDDESADPKLKLLEKIRLKYNPLFGMIGQMGVEKENILAISTFTTASKTLSVSDFKILAQELGNVGAGSKTLDAALSDMTNAITTSSNLPYEAGVKNEYLFIVQSILQKFSLPDLSFLVNPDNPASVAGNPIISGSFDTMVDLNQTDGIAVSNIKYKIFNWDKYTDGVIIFQHGFGRFKEDAMAFAMRNNTYPVIAIDLPLHGERDGTPDDNSDSGSTYLSSNMAHSRLNLYQSFLDISMLIKGLKAGKFDINGDGTNDTPSFIGFTGMSLGSITGSVAVNKNPQDIDKVVLNVGGASFSSLLDTGKNALLTGIISKFELEKNTPAYFITMGILQLLIDPADPAYLAKDLAVNIPDTIFEFAYNDTVVSNVSNQILAKVAGSQGCKMIKTFEDSDNIIVSPGYSYMFGGEEENTKNWMTHGFLLDPSIFLPDGTTPKYPEAADFLDADYVSDGNTAVNKLNNKFFN